ncbi:MAG: AtpZ/AtpI family protein [Ignavibacteriae bacterium]|nr:AtpZ/AtpI family protein [Ignavibacteriota bacterium]
MSAPGKKPAGVIQRQVGSFLTLGLQLALSVVFFFFVGYWLDGKLGTSPWGSIIGAVVGVTGGLIKFLKDAVALGKKADEDFRAISGKSKSEH